MRSSVDGKETQVIKCSTHSCDQNVGDCIADVVFVLDSSGSIGSLNWSVSLQFVIDVMKGLNIKADGTRVSVVIYSTEVKLSFGLTQYYSMAVIEPIVFNLKYMAGITNTADGIKKMREVIASEGRGPNIATPIGIVITDGKSNVDAARTLVEANGAKAEDIVMFSVAIGSGINPVEIDGIATDPNNVFKAASYEDAQQLSDEIADRICSWANHKKCGPCGDYGPCNVKCGVDGLMTGNMECWLVSGKTNTEKPGSRNQTRCNKTCNIPCPKKECGPCGDYGDCSESCGLVGTQNGIRECWLNDGTTGNEIPRSREEVPCNDTCYVKCPPLPVCGPCGEYGPCSESCGKDGTKESTKDCWEEDADTRDEIIGSRHQVQCIDTCYVKCPPIPVCGPCGEYGLCSESCGKDGTKEGTKDCWEEDADTRDEIIGSRHQVQCIDTCYVKCPPIPVCGPCGDYGPCSESCGAEGTKEGTKDCWEEDADSKDEIVGSRHEVTCIGACFIECPWEPDCSRCDYTKGQIWLQDRNNCHMYFICEPIGNGQYRIHHVTCGELFWNQPNHMCVPVMPADANCVIGPVSLYIQPSTPAAPCSYQPYPGDPTKFWISGDPLTIRYCIEGMKFVNMGDLCDCLPDGPLIPTCADDLLLHFPYDNHYNDVTCHHAIATQYGTGVSIRFDSDRNGNVACFTGGTHFEVAFLRTWFANNKVDKFTVSVWFKRHGEQVTPQGIVNNGDCIDTAGFLIGHALDGVVANITTEDDHAQTPLNLVPSGVWNHAVWVYDGTDLKLYINNVLTLPTTPMTGYLTNNDVPMYIANCCGKHFFIGCLDELRVYDRALSPTDIRNLP
ncbi:hypothetical protein LSAT2_012610 [Lamellibrachia satsuma]|nr:hypothetical protein LSAT2_012610 [Lamellibrachia satsuma]